MKTLTQLINMSLIGFFVITSTYAEEIEGIPSTNPIKDKIEIETEFIEMMEIQIQEDIEKAMILYHARIKEKKDKLEAYRSESKD